ncbi:phosphoethanolamine transferase domain-containing protein [Chitinolyticbacter meiyuanensis]|uniref:phosphoethanolamine transferase domain-containing protein n=1 Tax=Chitinolyticbacter meiyuanensis TaxID=682798 RepID=UPI0016522E64|nr:phosphoethanolamine transferase domain-containing protein [Chitinolyticbacter meiyuanensis]
MYRWHGARCPLRREPVFKLALICGSLLLILLTALLYYQIFASVVRNHRELRWLLTPTNYLQAADSYVRQRLRRPRQLVPITPDACRAAV